MSRASLVVKCQFCGGYWSYGKRFIAQLPIRPINFGDVSERAEHDAIVKLVQRILTAKRAGPNSDTSAWEREIDERVYRLYGLTPDEMRIIEARASGPHGVTGGVQNHRGDRPPSIGQDDE